MPAIPARPHRTTAALGAWLLAVIGAGAWSAHFFYNGGKALAEVTRSKSINGPLDWLAGMCERWEFADFHRFAIILTAILAALPFLNRLLRHPSGLLTLECTALRKDRPGSRLAALRVLVCIVFFQCITLLVHGSLHLSFPLSWLLWLPGSFIAALLVELMFRGLLLHAPLLASHKKSAIMASTILYLMFFSALFPHGIDSWESVLSSGRFPLAQSLTSGLTDPAHTFGQTLPILLLGLSLGWVRTRSHSLWPVIGIQTGALLAWRISPHPLPALLAAILTVFVFYGLPLLRTPEKS